jgi:glycosyltransferase involved in cell wall biosynthesis
METDQPPRLGNPSRDHKATFIVFAYNQETLIRDAVNGAFSQTYQPLEIVLSDDASSDHTFKIMREMASAYNGPHTVRLVQNPENLGALRHAIARGREASTEIVVVAAGDDISEPERTSRIVKTFAADLSIGAVFSWVSLIDEAGEHRAFAKEKVLRTLWGRGIFLRDRTKNTVVRGCSAAYRNWVFDAPIKADSRVYAEDMFLSFYINALGSKIEIISEPLVKYRQHQGAFNFSGTTLTASEEKEFTTAPKRLEYLSELELFAKKIDKEQQIDRKELLRMREFFQDVADWPNLTPAQRLKQTLRTSYFRGDFLPSLKRSIWRAVRLWGQYPVYQPKVTLARYQKQHRP